MTQFVLHSALDVGKEKVLCLLSLTVEEAQWAKALTYLGEVDSYKQLKVHCFVSAGCIHSFYSFNFFNLFSPSLFKMLSLCCYTPERVRMP